MTTTMMMMMMMIIIIIITCIFMLLFIQYCPGDKIEKNEMGGTCSTYGGREEVYTGYWRGNLREGDQLEDRQA